MARACAACNHPQSAALDRDSVRGTISVRDLARKYGISESSAYRHKQNHLQRRLLAELRTSDTIRTTDLLEMLSESLTDLSTVRASAMLSGQSALAVRAGAELRATVEFLLSLGIEDTTVVNELKWGGHIATAIARAANRAPEFGELVAAELRLLGELQSAADLDLVIAAAPTSQELETRNDF